MGICPKPLYTTVKNLSNSRIFIGIDDTDNLDSRGTGQLARSIAGNLTRHYRVQGVTRHQLLIDPRVPYTKNNSSAAIALLVKEASEVPNIFERVKSMILADFQIGSDPGLCVTTEEKALRIAQFGRRSQSEYVTQEEARFLATSTCVLLAGLGGDQNGVIGALAAVGLAASGEDGRYILIGRLRQMEGLQPISALLDAGISQVCTLDGHPVHEGSVFSDKLRPSRRRGMPVLFVEKENDYWRALKLD